MFTNGLCGLLAVTLAAPPAAGKYAVLVDPGPGDAFLPAAKALADFHQASETGLISLSTTASLMRAPPPRISRRASPLEVASPLRQNSSKAGMPRASRSRGTAVCGNPLPLPPASNTARAVSAAASAAALP